MWTIKLTTKYSKWCLMEGFIRLGVLFAKLTLNILEGVLRAVLGTSIAVVCIGIVAVSGVIISLVLIKYSDCDAANYCITPRNCVGAIVVAGWALVVYTLYHRIKSWFE